MDERARGPRYAVGMRWNVLVLLALAACGGGASQTCDDLCNVLILQCGYEAFPDFASCQQGCAYEQEQGEDVNATLACVQAAASSGSCDTFAILECEHAP